MKSILLYMFSILLSAIYAAPLDITNSVVTTTSNTTVVAQPNSIFLGDLSPTSIETLVRSEINSFTRVFGDLDPKLCRVEIMIRPHDECIITSTFNLPDHPTLLGEATMSVTEHVTRIKVARAPYRWRDQPSFDWDERPISFAEAMAIAESQGDLAPPLRNTLRSDIRIAAADRAYAEAYEVPVGRLMYLWNIVRDPNAPFPDLVIVDMVTREVKHEMYSALAPGKNETVAEV